MNRYKAGQRGQLFLIALLALVGGFFIAASAHAETMNDLKARFEKRFPELRRAKDAGKIGEDSSGMVDAVQSKYLSDANLKKLMDDENHDRTELYQMIAAQQQTTAALVADRAAKRNFEQAHAGDWLKGADGKWTQKK